MTVTVDARIRRNLIAAAREAAAHAYCPYSNYPVGAALLTREGQIITGCNVENVSFGLTLCAERTALVKAVSDGVREFAALAVVGGRPRHLPRVRSLPSGAGGVLRTGHAGLLCASHRRTERCDYRGCVCCHKRLLKT